jgi:hypothetical protein
VSRRSNYLAQDVCETASHLLAWVTMQDDEMIVAWNQAEVRNMAGNVRRDQKSKVIWGRAAAQVEDGTSGALATCGCGEDHSVNLTDLVRRARDGDARPKRIPAVHR